MTKFRGRWLPLVGYLILAGGVGGAFAQSHENAVQANKQIVRSTQAVLLTNCHRGNRLRVVLKGLVLQELKGIDAAVARGQFPATEVAAAKKQVHKDANKVGPVPCSIVNQIK